MSVLKAPTAGVTVRMYAQELGGWFLLAFPTDQTGAAFYLLIDSGDPGAKTRDDLVVNLADELVAATGGEIHLLVATHGHLDVNRLSRIETLSRHVRIQEVWLPWTDDPFDRLAKRLRASLERDRTLLHSVLSRSGNRQAREVAALLGFSGASSPAPTQETDSIDGPENGELSRVASPAVRRPKGKVGTGRRYLQSGDGPFQLSVRNGPRVPNVRVFILGPPRDEDALAHINLTAARTDTSDEIATLTARTALLLALRKPQDLIDNEKGQRDLCFPFSENVRVQRRVAERDPFFQDHYGFVSGSNSHWRRIDNEWQGLALGIARQVTDQMRQTRLALAIELVDTGKVLLLAGGDQLDAWSDSDGARWTIAVDTRPIQTVRTSTLLRRTTLYLVSDYGAGYATAHGSNLQYPMAVLPTSPALVALLPVARTEEPKHVQRRILANPLLRRIDERVSWRILQSDNTFPRSGPASVNAGEWRAFKAHFKETRNYRQYTVTQ